MGLVLVTARGKVPETPPGQMQPPRPVVHIFGRAPRQSLQPSQPRWVQATTLLRPSAARATHRRPRGWWNVECHRAGSSCRGSRCCSRRCRGTPRLRRRRSSFASRLRGGCSRLPASRSCSSSPPRRRSCATLEGRRASRRQGERWTAWVQGGRARRSERPPQNSNKLLHAIEIRHACLLSSPQTVFLRRTCPLDTTGGRPMADVVAKG
eukprot:2279662-Prymnesium_polylepis.1